MATTYTPEDVERADAWLERQGLNPSPYLYDLAQLIADVREGDAKLCDDVAAGSSRTPSEKALARQLAKRIREGRP